MQIQHRTLGPRRMNGSMNSRRNQEITSGLHLHSNSCWSTEKGGCVPTNVWLEMAEKDWIGIFAKSESRINDMSAVPFRQQRRELSCQFYANTK